VSFIGVIRIDELPRFVGLAIGPVSRYTAVETSPDMNLDFDYHSAA
jgi:hypothetical protein